MDSEVVLLKHRCLDKAATFAFFLCICSGRFRPFADMNLTLTPDLDVVDLLNVYVGVGGVFNPDNLTEPSLPPFCCFTPPPHPHTHTHKDLNVLSNQFVLSAVACGKFTSRSKDTNLTFTLCPFSAWRTSPTIKSQTVV